MKISQWYLTAPVALAMVLAPASLRAQSNMGQGNMNQPNSNQRFTNQRNMNRYSANRAVVPQAQLPNQKRFEDISRLLDLSPQQRSRAHAIMQNAWNATEPLIPQVQQNRDALENMIRAGNTNTAQVDRYARREGELISQMITIRTRALGEFTAMLNPAQREKIADLYDLLGPGMHGVIGRGPAGRAPTGPAPGGPTE